PPPGPAPRHSRSSGSQPAGSFAPVLVGVVGSGNLEVLVEPASGSDCLVHIEPSARGFGPIWEAVVRDFHQRHPLAGVRVSINDMGATPAVVSLRLEQAGSAVPTCAPPSPSATPNARPASALRISSIRAASTSGCHPRSG